jgi:hypothetical protein
VGHKAVDEMCYVFKKKKSRIVRDTNEASEDIHKTMNGSRDEAWRRSRDLFKGI